MSDLDRTVNWAAVLRAGSIVLNLIGGNGCSGIRSHRRHDLLFIDIFPA